MSGATNPELIFVADQLGAHLQARCVRDGIDQRSVVWAARRQLDLAREMFDDDQAAIRHDPNDTAALAMAAWWALIVGTGLGDQDLAALARSIWEDAPDA